MSKRRLISLVLVLMLIFALISCMASCDRGTEGDQNVTEKPTETPTSSDGKECEHEYTNACDADCNACGEERTPSEHVPQTVGGRAATCTEAGLSDGSACAVCNAILAEQETIPATGHNYGDDNKCDGCGHVKEEAHTHSYTSAVTAPTCTDRGYTTYTCDCGESYEDLYVDAKGHTEEIDVATPPTCTDTGLTAGSHCSDCGEILVKQEIVGAVGHAYAEGGVTRYGSDDTHHWRVCRTCGYEEKEAKAEHSMVGKNCNVCGYGCTHEAGTAATCTSAAICRNCGLSFGDALGHEFSEENYTINVPATCTENAKETAKCTRCDVTNTREVANSAKGHTTVDDERVEPTCTTDGLTAGSHCSACNKVFEKQEIIPSKDHDQRVNVPGYDARCGAAGLTDGKKCSGCGKVTVEQKVIPALEHDMNITIEGYAATCTRSGLTDGKKCSKCGEVQTAQSIIQPKGHNYTIVVTAPACTAQGYTEYTCTEGDHSYIGDYKDATGHNHVAGDTIAPTCTTDGYTVYTCGCGDTYNGNTVGKTGHRYNEAVTAPTCTKDGFTTYTCESCKDSYVGDETEAKGHTPITDERVEPTCTKAGLSEGSHCDVCDEVLVEQNEIKALGHTVVINAAVAPTCTSTGLSEGSYCSACDETIAEQRVLEALPHAYNEQSAYGSDENGHWRICSVCKNEPESTSAEHTYNSNSTCTTCGYGCSAHVGGEATCTEYARCESCGAPYGELQAHTLGEYISNNDARCEIDGTESAICTGCGVYKETRTDAGSALAHIYGEWVIDTQATCTTAGNKHKTCSNADCGKVVHEVIPATGHTYNSTVTSPTCTNDGYTTYTCERGDHTYKADYIDALGHTEVVDVAIAPTCTESGLSEGSHCNVCQAVIKKQEKVEALGHTEKTVPGYAADCTTAGLTDGVKCSACQITLTEQKAIPALGHNEDTVIAGYAATCSREGLTDGYACSRCGEEQEAGKPIGKLPHTPVKDAATAPDCESTGLTEGSHCDVCKEVIIKQEIVEAKGHDSSISIPAVAPACSETGLTEGKRCSVCGKVQVGQQIVEALGHTEQITPGYAADCTTAGLTDGVKCSVCNATLAEQKEIAALGHTEKAVTGYAASCTTAGLTDGVKCSVCNVTLTEQKEIAALGHTEKAVTGYAASCTTAGLTDGVKCSVCNATLTEQKTIAALGHKWTNATCTIPKTCSVCQATEGAALGHVYSNDSDTTCNNCDYVRETVIVHNYNVKTGMCVDCGIAHADYSDVSNVYTMQEAWEYRTSDGKKLLAKTDAVSSNVAFDGYIAPGQNNWINTGSNSTPWNGEVINVSANALKLDINFFGWVALGNFALQEFGVFADELTSVDDIIFNEDVDLHLDMYNGTGVLAATNPAYSNDIINYTGSANARRYCVALFNTHKVLWDNLKTQPGEHTIHIVAKLEGGYYIVVQSIKINVVAHECTFPANGTQGVGTVTAPTCTADGYTTVGCTRTDSILCSSTSKINVIGALGHKAESTWTYDGEGHHYHKCTNGCGGKLDVASCSGTDGQRCDTCQSVYNCIHQWSAPDANTGRITCGSVCGASYTPATYINPTILAAHTSGSVKSENGYAIIPGDRTQFQYVNGSMARYVVVRYNTTRNSTLAFSYYDTAVAEHQINLQALNGNGEWNTVILDMVEPISMSPNLQIYGIAGDWQQSGVGTKISGIATFASLEEAQKYEAALNYEAPAGCEHASVTEQPAVSATCTSGGKTAGKTCNDCGAVLTAQVAIPALGHTEVIDAAVAPTCTATGLTQGKHCSACNVTITAQQTVDALGHDVQYVGTADMHKACTRCDEKTTASHEGSFTYTDIAATCTVPGGRRAVCNCGYSYMAAETTPALGHDVQYVGTADMHKKCTRCDEATTASHAGSYTETSRVDPTCTTAGTGNYKCSCGYTFSQSIAALGHYPTTEWTYDGNGYHYQKCVRNCGHQFNYEACQSTSGQVCNKCGAESGCNHKWTISETTGAVSCGGGCGASYTPVTYITPSTLASPVAGTVKVEDSYAVISGDRTQYQYVNGSMARYVVVRYNATRNSKIGFTYYDTVVAAHQLNIQTLIGDDKWHTIVLDMKEPVSHSSTKQVYGIAGDWDMSGEGLKISAIATFSSLEAAQGYAQALDYKSSSSCMHLNYEALSAVAATCTTSGKTAGTQCIDCGAVVKAQSTTAVLGHSKGSDGFCTRCGSGTLSIPIKSNAPSSYLNLLNTATAEFTTYGGVQCIKFVTTDKADPYVWIDILNYQKSVLGYADAKTLNLTKTPFIVVKVQTQGCSGGSLNAYFHTDATTYSISSEFIPGNSNWHYIIYNLTGFTGQVTLMRFDLDSATANSNTIYISDIVGCGTYKDALGYMGTSSAPNTTPTLTPSQMVDKTDLLSNTTPMGGYESYVIEKATNEDESINLWFNHTYTRTPQSQVSPSGLFSYKIMLAKNEIEGCQLILSSAASKTGLSITVSDFIHTDGSTRMTSEVLMGYYFDIEGEMVIDPLPPTQGNFATFSLNNTSQTFVIKAKSAQSQKAGEYVSTVIIKNSSGQEVKRVKVFAYVWNFMLPETSSCKTLMDLDNYNLLVLHKDWNGEYNLYQNYYNFLLENRICAYTLPGESKDGNYSGLALEYIRNPRVSAFLKLGWKTALTSDNVRNAYNSLNGQTDSAGNSLLDKGYYYPKDEAKNQSELDAIISAANTIRSVYGNDYNLIAPMHTTGHIVGSGGKVDDFFSYVASAVTVWCPKTFFFNTLSDYANNPKATQGQSIYAEKTFGTFADRMANEQAGGDEVWWYVTRRPNDPETTLIINTEATRYRLLFWQQKLYNVDGFLYYLCNDWYPASDGAGVDNKNELQTEMSNTSAWYSKHEISSVANYDLYGNGVLIYPGVRVADNYYNAVGSLRLECVRDGIEDFEYFTILEQHIGKDKVDMLINELTTSVIDYDTDAEKMAYMHEALGSLIEKYINT